MAALHDVSPVTGPAAHHSGGRHCQGRPAARGAAVRADRQDPRRLSSWFPPEAGVDRRPHLAVKGSGFGLHDLGALGGALHRPASPTATCRRRAGGRWRPRWSARVRRDDGAQAAASTGPGSGRLGLVHRMRPSLCLLEDHNTHNCAWSDALICVIIVQRLHFYNAPRGSERSRIAKVGSCQASKGQGQCREDHGSARPSSC